MNDNLPNTLESTAGLGLIQQETGKHRQQLLNRTKCLAFAIFALSTFTDAMLTTYLLRGEGIAEANPIIVLAMEGLPGGMFSLKAGVLVAIGLFWRKCTASFLLLIAFGMTAISFWNSILVALTFP